MKAQAIAAIGGSSWSQKISAREHLRKIFRAQLFVAMLVVRNSSVLSIEIESVSDKSNHSIAGSSTPLRLRGSSRSADRCTVVRCWVRVSASV